MSPTLGRSPLTSTGSGTDFVNGLAAAMGRGAPATLAGIVPALRRATGDRWLGAALCLVFAAIMVAVAGWVLFDDVLDRSKAMIVGIPGTADVRHCEEAGRRKARAVWNCTASFTAADGSFRISSVRLVMNGDSGEPPAGSVAARASGPHATSVWPPSNGDWLGTFLTVAVLAAMTWLLLVGAWQALGLPGLRRPRRPRREPERRPQWWRGPWE
jgi:hypothetical protein